MEYMIYEINKGSGTVVLTCSVDGILQTVHGAPLDEGMDAMIDFLDDYCRRYTAAAEVSGKDGLESLIYAKRKVTDA